MEQQTEIEDLADIQKKCDNILQFLNQIKSEIQAQKEGGS